MMGLGKHLPYLRIASWTPELAARFFAKLRGTCPTRIWSHFFDRGSTQPLLVCLSLKRLRTTTSFDHPLALCYF